MAVANLPTHDEFDLVQEIREAEQRLGELDHELKDALAIYRDAKYQLLIAETKRSSIRAEIEITKARIMAKQSMLRAMPR